jgi:hypothetical protein
VTCPIGAVDAAMRAANVFPEPAGPCQDAHRLKHDQVADGLLGELQLAGLDDPRRSEPEMM